MAEKQRELALRQAEKQRKNALRQAEKQREMAEKQRELALRQAEKQREFAKKQQAFAEKQWEFAEKQREFATRQAEEARRQSRTASKVDSETTNWEWIKQSRVTSFSNAGGKTNITVKIITKGPLKVKQARVRYNGKWHDINSWNANSNENPFNTTTTIQLTGPRATKFSQDDIVEISTANTKYRLPLISKK